MKGGKGLEEVFEGLRRMMEEYVPPFKGCDGEIRAKRDFHLKVPKAVAIPGAYGGTPVEVAVASVILQKGYVGFYYMPVYMQPEVRKKISPALMKLLKGKSCFYVKELTPEVREGIAGALKIGEECFRGRGWI